MSEKKKFDMKKFNQQKHLHDDKKPDVPSKELSFGEKFNRIRMKLTGSDESKLRHKPESSFMITMHFRNGTERTWVINTRKNWFRYQGQTYVINYEDMMYDLSMGRYRAYYHEDYATPINREIEQKGDSAYFAVRPENMKPVLDMEYVKKLVEDNLSLMLMITMITTFVVLLATLIIIWMITRIGK